MAVRGPQALDLESQEFDGVLQFVVFPPEMFDQDLGRYRRYFRCVHIWGELADPVMNCRPQVPRAGELVECYGTSMGFNLWRTSMFRDPRLKRPWFRTLCSATEGIGTQDLAAWNDFRKYGYRCAVDCSVLVGHHDLEGKFGPADFVW